MLNHRALIDVISAQRLQRMGQGIGVVQVFDNQRQRSHQLFFLQLQADIGKHQFDFRIIGKEMAVKTVGKSHRIGLNLVKTVFQEANLISHGKLSVIRQVSMEHAQLRASR